MGATASIKSTNILSQVRREANKPTDLSDLDPTTTLIQLRTEVSRLRNLLHQLVTNKNLHLQELKPTIFQEMILPIPTQEELKILLEKQIQAKHVLEVRLQRASASKQ